MPVTPSPCTNPTKNRIIYYPKITPFELLHSPLSSRPTPLNRISMRNADSPLWKMCLKATMALFLPMGRPAAEKPTPSWAANNIWNAKLALKRKNYPHLPITNPKNRKLIATSTL